MMPRPKNVVRDVFLCTVLVHDHNERSPMIEQHEHVITLEEARAEFDRLAHAAYLNMQLATLAHISLLGLIFVASLAVALK